jgi:hypothetical protein
MVATTAALGTTAVVASAASAGAAAAGTAAAAGGIGATLAALATSTSGILGLASAGLGIATSIAGSNIQKGVARQAAYDESLAAKAGRLRGEQEQNKIKKALLRDVSAANARAGQAGFGPMLLNQQAQGAESDAADALNTSQFNTYMEARQRRAQASVYRRAGKTSILDIIGPIGEGAGRVATTAAYL